MKTLRLLAFVAAGFAYAVIVLGYVVRITGSGMGCGDDWPLCNGRIIPPLDQLETVLEYGHRLAVLGLSALALPLAVLAYLNRDHTGGLGRGGTLRPAVAGLILLVLQALIGALAVKLELPPWTVIVHLGIGLALLAVLMTVGLRAGRHLGITAPPAGQDLVPNRLLIATLVIGVLALMLGGLTANLGAAAACQGFPLCTGQLWPAGGESGLPHIHWTHRLLAYAFFVTSLLFAVKLTRRGASARLAVAAWVAFGTVAAQVIVAAIMVLAYLPPVWRALHAVVGTLVWVALVYVAWLALAGREEPVPTAGATREPSTG
ncbi:MAG: heme A synthase [Gemmatimonadales bacterium]